MQINSFYANRLLFKQTQTRNTHTRNEIHVKHSELKIRTIVCLNLFKNFLAGFHHVIETDKIGHYQIWFQITDNLRVKTWKP